MKHLVIILTLLITDTLNAQQLKKGLLMPDQDFKVCCVYIPDSGLKVYDKPNGVSIGDLTLGSTDNNNEIYKVFVQIGNENREFEYSNLHMVGYEVMAVVYTAKQDGFVKTNNGYWLSVEELKSKGLIPTTWMDYLINKDDVLGWYANEPGLNLRTEPSVNSKILATLKGDLWEITPMKETNGLWCKVTVKEYREHPCSGEDDLVLRTLTGWVKLLSDEQTPNVWNYAKGC